MCNWQDIITNTFNCNILMGNNKSNTVHLKYSCYNLVRLLYKMYIYYQHLLSQMHQDTIINILNYIIQVEQYRTNNELHLNKLYNYFHNLYIVHSIRIAQLDKVLHINCYSSKYQQYMINKYLLYLCKFYMEKYSSYIAWQFNLQFGQWGMQKSIEKYLDYNRKLIYKIGIQQQKYYIISKDLCKLDIPY